MNRRTQTVVGAALLAIGLAACSSDTTGLNTSVSDTQITQGIIDDAGESIAQSVNELVLNDVASGANSSVVAPNGASLDVAATNVNCSGPDAQGWYTCTAVNENGLTVTRQIRFWEGTNFGLWWSPTKTDSVNHIWSAVGTVNSPVIVGKTWDIDRHDTATMAVNRAASPEQHVWNGVGAHHEVSTRDVSGVTRTWDHTAFDTAAAITFQVPRSTYPYPLSGSYTRNVTTVFTAGSFQKTVTRRIVVTFNGTNVAQLQVGALTCDLDLATRQVSNCH